MSNDKEILKELREISKNKEEWKSNIDYLASILNENTSIEVKAKA